MNMEVTKPANAVALISFNDMQSMAKVIVNSRLFGMQNIDQALGLMLIAQAHGRHPALIAEEYDIIQGRPALKSHSMLSRFQNAGGRIEWIERTDTACEAVFFHDQSGTLKVRWTFEQAQKANLTGKDNWKRHPRQMLSARVISEGVKACYPACIGSAYTPEEVMDFDNVREEKPEITAATVVESTPTTQATEDLQPMPPTVDIRAYLGEHAGLVERFLRVKGVITDGKNLYNLGVKAMAKLYHGSEGYIAQAKEWEKSLTNITHAPTPTPAPEPKEEAESVAPELKPEFAPAEAVAQETIA